MEKAIEQKIYNILSEHPSLILIIKNKYVTDNMWKICITKEPSLFQYMKNPSEEMCLFAVNEEGSYLCSRRQRP